MVRLSSIGFIWSPSEQKWRTMVAQLRDFRATHGTLAVPARGETRQLSRFNVACQKALAEHMAGRSTSLEDWQVQLLLQAGVAP